MTENVEYGLGYGHATPIKSHNSTTQSKGENAYIKDDDDPPR